MYYLGLAAQVCYETVQVSNRTRALVKAWKVPINKEIKHPYRMSSYHDLIDTVEKIKNGYIEIVEKAEEEQKTILTPPPHESVWNLFNAMDYDTQGAVREYTSDMTLFPKGFDLDHTSLDELVRITTAAIQMHNRIKLPGKTASPKHENSGRTDQKKQAQGKGSERQGRNARPAQQFPGFQKHAYTTQVGAATKTSTWSGEYPTCKDCWWKPVAPHSDEDCLLAKRNMFPVPKPSTVEKGNKATYLSRDEWGSTKQGGPTVRRMANQSHQPNSHPRPPKFIFHISVFKQR